MAQPHLGYLTRFTTIDDAECDNAQASMKYPLSGYIGGDPRGGYWVERLTEEWKAAFGVEHAVPCNSATSGLLAACMAIGVGHGDEVWTTPYSMSATAACAKVLGARVRFIDIESDRFGIDPLLLDGISIPNGELRDWLMTVGKPKPKAIIVTNLFGHPAHLYRLKAWCKKHVVYLIEDNAQAPFATAHEKYTGTIGDIGVFSLNVHKHIQCGEGGVVVTNDWQLCHGVQGAINHGELNRDIPRLGLNMRMTEPIAAIACAQLAKAEGVIEGRRQIGLELCDMVKDVPWIIAHKDQPGCKHVYYLWTAQVDTYVRAVDLITGLDRHGVPIRTGYAPLLNRLFPYEARVHQCPVAADINNHIIVFEVCAYDLRRHHLDTMREIIKRVTGDIHESNAA